jgi:hypothetical protein
MDLLYVEKTTFTTVLPCDAAIIWQNVSKIFHIYLG